MEWRLREATPADAETLSQTVAQGFEGYRSFAPPGWRPPADETDATRSRLGTPELWCLLAESPSGQPAGHVAVMPAALHAGRPSDDPELAHLWQLFVRERWWGSGLAGELHSRMVEGTAQRGYRLLRLFVAAGQTRARRFYEREGWTLHAEPRFEAALGLSLVEYRYALTSP